jgi:hypothetical protein
LLSHNISKYQVIIVKNKIVSMLGICLLAASFDASADVRCPGTVSYLGIDGSNGNLFVALNDTSHTHAICNLNAQGAFTVTPAVCKVMYASLLQAKTTGSSVWLYYSDTSFTCSTIPNWGAMPSMYYLGLN